MKVLVSLFLLSALGCSLAEGRIVTKCELKQAFYNLSQEAWPKGLSLTEDFVAKIACHVGLASGFNTSAVNQLNAEQEDSDSDSGERRHAGHHQEEEVKTLYGLFQLSDDLVCSNGNTTSPDLCGMACSGLLDDDIHNDIGCLLTVLGKIIKQGFGFEQKKDLTRIIRLIFRPQCAKEKGSEYFAGC